MNRNQSSDGRFVSQPGVEMLEDRRLLSAAPAIVLENLDGLPNNSRLVFNRLQNPNPQVNDIVHDTDVLRIRNTGSAPLVINSVALSDATDFQIVNPPAAGTTVAAGGVLDLTVKFVAQSVPPHSTNETNDVQGTDGTPPLQGGGVYTGTLTVNSNAPASPAAAVQLAGYWQKSSEHEEEPNLATIVNLLYGYGTNIGNTGPDLPNNGTTPVTYGEEVNSGLWAAANPAQPITVRQLAAFHTQVDPFNAGHLLSANLGWYQQGSGATNNLFQHAMREAQSLLPHLLNSSTAPAQASFQPNGAFGWNVDGEYSQNNLNTTDITQFHRSGHADRFYPARDAQGNLIPNTWIIAEDYQNSTFDNSDYQDNVYLVTNMRPTTQAPAPASAQAVAGSGKVTVSWAGVNDAALVGYNVYRSTSINGNYQKINGAPVAGTSLVDSNAPSNQTFYYRVTAVDSAGESEGTSASTSSASVGQPPPGNTAGPDLTVGPVVGNFPASALDGSGPKIGAHVLVTNSSATTQKGTIEIDLYASPTAGVVPAGATPVSTVIRKINLKTGKSKVFNLPRFRFPNGLSGNYFLVAQAKTVAGLTDTTTGQDVNSSATSIKVGPAVVDIQNLFSTAPILTAGKRTAISIPLMNNGNVTAHGTATVTVTASTSRSGGSPIAVSSFPLHLSLRAGQERTFVARFLTPTLAAGTYYIVTNVSLPGDVNASNDTAVSGGTVTV